MRSYFLKRLLLMVPTFLGVTLLVFVITRFVPGGPIERMLAQRSALSPANDLSRKSDSMGSRSSASSSLSEEQLQELRVYYGFDQPSLSAYARWLGQLLRGDLGLSSRYNDPVWPMLRERLPISLFFGVLTLLLSYGLCLPLGLWKALGHERAFDKASSLLLFIAYAIPSYVLALLLLLVFAVGLEWLPLSGLQSEGYEGLSTGAQLLDRARHVCLPLFAYVCESLAVTVFLLKNSLLDTLHSDYLRTALAKGVAYPQAVRRHALRNALIPLAASLGRSIGLVLSGSFLIETIFNIPGFGLLGYDALMQRDYPVVMGVLVLSSLLFLLGNLLADIFVALLDPRIDFTRRST